MELGIMITPLRLFFAPHEEGMEIFSFPGFPILFFKKKSQE